MDNNDILIRLRYALDLKNTEIVEIFKLGGIEVDRQDLPKLYGESIFHLTNGLPFDFSKITYNYENSQFFIQANSHFM